MRQGGIERLDPIRILVADDHELIRLGLVSILTRHHPEWQVVALARNGAEAVEMGLALRPDVAIVDLLMPHYTGLQVAGRLIQNIPGIHVTILTMYASSPILRQLQKAGVKAYLAKNEAPRLLVAAVEGAIKGDPFFASTAARRSVGELEESEYVPAQFLLSPRELDVLRELARGKSNKQVAADLSISARTVETHHANLLAKLEANSLADLVRIAFRDRVI